MRSLVLLAVLIPASALAQPGSPPPPGGGYAPAPGAPVYAPPASGAALHNGMTFEANVGLGWMRISSGGASDTSDVSLAGADVGVGGWINPNLALTVRINGITDSQSGGKIINGMLGPNLQYWVDDHLWVGGGAGVAVFGVIPDQGNSDSIRGFGFDLRAGYTFPSTTENTFNVSFELSPGFFSENGADATLTGIAILAGYQHL